MNQLTEYRREFHKYPENGWREFRTSARVAEILTGMGYDVAMGPDVIEPGSVGEPERLSEEQIRQEMERAVRQGADPAFVKRTQGWPGVMAVLGILGYNVLYLLLIVLGDNASRWHLWLGLLAGLADGCYWLSYGHLLSDSTDLSNRDSGLAIVNICANVVNLTIPLLAGFIIDAVGGTRGYMAVFGLSFAVSAVTCALALRLPKRRMAGAHKVDYPRTLRAIGRNRHLLYSLAAQGCKGVREGAFTFILSIVLYQMVKNELLVGFNTFLSAAAAIASYVIASRILSLANRVRYMGVAVAVLTGIAALCILHLSPMTVILYTVVNSFFAGFLENSTYSTFLDMMQLVPEMDNHRPELLAVNDTVLELGRCVGLSIIIVMNVYVGEDVGVQVWSLLVLTLTQVGTVLLCRGAMRSAKQAAPGA